MPDAPEFPESVNHVWHWFWELHDRRGVGFESRAPISFNDIYVWSLLTNTFITPAEVRLICTMDKALLEQMGEEHTAMQERQREKAKSQGKKGAGR